VDAAEVRPGEQGVLNLTTNYREAEPHDMPANYQVKAGNLSFSGGHGETKRWRSAFLTSAPTREPSGGTPNNPDYIWLMKNTTVPVGGDWP
jgi:hypothetical protein